MRLYRYISKSICHHWLTVAFLFGFLVDSLTLNRVDRVFDNIVLSSYVILAMISIFYLYVGIAERYSEKTNRFFKTKAPLLMQYSFGGLLSGMLIFYGRGSSLEDSWPFIFIILAVIYGNETIKNRASRLVYNLAIFFIGLFSYIVLIIPVLIGKMGPFIFIVSGFLALTIMHLFLKALNRIIPNYIRLQKRIIVFAIGLIYVLMNFFYFTNIIPPIPLSLKEIGIYHMVVRYEDGTYVLTYEKPEWWEWYRHSDKIFHYEKGDNIFCFASVFAPSRLTTEIFHRWEFYDDETKEWINHGRYAYPILGGRSDGYRGYTLTSNYHEGKWRCTVETDRGQVIGKEVFFITSDTRGELVTEIK